MANKINILYILLYKYSHNCNSICQTIPCCSPINLTQVDVVASISKIKPGKTGGPDGISVKVLKSCCHHAVEMCNGKATPGFVASWNCRSF